MSFIEKARLPTPAPPLRALPAYTPTGSLTPAGSDSAYAAKALTAELESVRSASSGTRNDALNRAAFNLGQLIGGGELNERDTMNALYDAAIAAGLEHAESVATIRSGVENGKQEPRGVPVRGSGVSNAIRKVDTDWAIPAPRGPEGGADAGEPSEDEHAEARRAWAAQHFQPIDWQALWDDTSEEEWILEPLLPARRLIALYSAPKVGKSLLMLELAVAIATGRSALGVVPDRARRVLYVDFENDPKSDIRERLQAMGHSPSDLADLIYLSYPTLGALDERRGGLELVAACEHYQTEVVVVDTVSRAVVGEENENDTWLGFYRNTGLELKRRGIALVRLDHSGKDETKGQRGGSAKSGDIDAVWRLSRVTDDTFQLDCEANRMPIAERTIVLERRDTPHLHHHVNALGRIAAHEAARDEVVRYLDSIDYDVNAGRDTVRQLLKGTGIKGRNDAISAAIKIRKARVQSLDD